MNENKPPLSDSHPSSENEVQSDSGESSTAMGVALEGSAREECSGEPSAAENAESSSEAKRRPPNEREFKKPRELIDHAIGVQTRLALSSWEARDTYANRLSSYSVALGNPSVTFHNEATIVRVSSLPHRGDNRYKGQEARDFHGGVYDALGEIVPHTRVVRGNGKSWECLVGDSASASVSATRHVDEEVVYGGYLFSHFGHLLLEGLARLWGNNLFENRIPIYVQAPGGKISPMATQLFELAGLTPSVRCITENTSFRGVIAPAPAYVHRHSVHLSFKNIFLRIADSAIGTKHLPVTEQPLYLSRGGLTGAQRSVLGEDILEEALHRSGVKIVQTEQLPLTEQIKLVNQHSTIIAPMGSALHLLMFSRIRQRAYVFSNNSPPIPFLLCDALNGTDATYLNVSQRKSLFGHPRFKKWQFPEILDVRATMRELRSIGLLADEGKLTHDEEAGLAKEWRRQFLTKALSESVKWKDVSIANIAERFILDEFSSDTELTQALAEARKSGE